VPGRSRERRGTGGSGFQDPTNLHMNGLKRGSPFLYSGVARREREGEREREREREREKRERERERESRRERQRETQGGGEGVPGRSRERRGTGLRWLGGRSPGCVWCGVQIAGLRV